MTGFDEIILHIERMAQIEALRRAAYTIFPHKEDGENQTPVSVQEYKNRLDALIQEAENGKKL